MTDETKKPGFGPGGVGEAAGQGFVADAAKPTPKPASGGRTLKVRRIGNSLGVVLPKEVLAKLDVGEGAMLSVIETPDGVALTPYDAEMERQLEAGRRAMRRYRNALRELAK